MATNIEIHTFRDNPKQLLATQESCDRPNMSQTNRFLTWMRGTASPGEPCGVEQRSRSNEF
jgi:hypothetical protein